MFQNFFVGKLNFAKTRTVGTITNVIAIYQIKDKLFKRHLHKMVKHTETIRRLLLTNDHYVWSFSGVGA